METSKDEMELYGCYRTKVTSKIFAIPILTAIASNIIKPDTQRTGIENAFVL